MERQTIDLLVSHAGRLLTCAGGLKRGAALADPQPVADGAVAIDAGVVVETGPRDLLERRFAPRQRIDAGGMLVTPGLVDPHTHVCYAGDRADEFELRLKGATYQQLLEAGGGILRTVRETSAAGVERLVSETLPRLRRMLAHGTTSVEIKTGYGLSTEHELTMIEALERLATLQPISIVPTFLGAHAIPPAYAGRADAYVDLIVDEMLPAVARRRAASSALRGPWFCDVFCEHGAFSLEQSRRILARAAELGFGLKLHVDEFEPLGGTALAVQLAACSADHLLATSAQELALLARSTTIGVALPGTPFGLGHARFMQARRFVDAGGALALATDCNPGTSVCESLPFMIALACRTMRLLPAEALQAATVNAAYASGLGQQAGSLEPGMPADLLIFDLPDERHLAYRFGTNPVALVLKAGRVVWERGTPYA